MKKLLILLLMTFLFYSCSSDSSSDSNPVATDSILIRRTIQTTSGSSQNAIINDFAYTGNKLNTITNSEGLVQKYFYTGDVITRMEWYVDNSGIPIIYDYTYTNGKLATMKKTDNLVDQEFRIVYTYNNDGTITTNNYSRTDNSGEEFDGQSKYFMTTTNEIQRIEDYNTAGTQIASTSTFVYDAKNNPFKNILGWGKLLIPGAGFYANVTSSVTNFGTQSATFQYNADNFPTTEVRSYSGNPGTTINLTFIYE
ncbi:hypothetical protein [Flavobacterium sp.]|uniref:hypothetical protein n=1 Tax=Flavobacterium sp. TaxID=239 RepID=UPI002620CFF7|nr:hypothetical protein [Flavobacterium sp.]